jgi:hypothetical protein
MMMLIKVICYNGIDYSFKILPAACRAYLSPPQNSKDTPIQRTRFDILLMRKTGTDVISLYQMDMCDTCFPHLMLLGVRGRQRVSFSIL